MSADEKEVELKLDDDPAAAIIRRWIELRQRQGMTREAAIAELNSVGSLLVGVNPAND